MKIARVLIILTILVLVFQGCTQCGQQSVSFGDNQSKSPSAGDGRPVGGKPDPGTYYRVVPGFECGGRPQIQSFIEVAANGEAVLNAMRVSDCRLVESTIDPVTLGTSALSKAFLTLGNGAFEKAEQEPDPAKSEIVAGAYCRLQTADSENEIAIYETPASGNLSAAVYSSLKEAGGWSAPKVQRTNLSRSISGTKVQYVADKFSLKIETSKLLPASSFVGELSFTAEGRNIVGNGECWLRGWEDLVGNASPSFAVNFLGGLLPQNVQFTRASSGTYFNSAGNVVSAGNNVPRFEYEPSAGRPLGLLIEEERTNLVLHSTKFTDANWQAPNMSIVQDGRLAGLDRFRIEKNNPANLEAFWRVHQYVSLTAGQQYTVSFFAERGNVDVARVLIWESPNNEVDIDFNLQTGTSQTLIANVVQLVATSAIKLKSGYRVSVTFIPSITGLVSIGIGPESTTLGDYIYATGGQVEQATRASSLILTDAATSTRREDSALIPSAEWFNSDEGTIQVAVNQLDFVGVPAVTNARIVELNGAASDHYILRGSLAPAGTVRFGAELNLDVRNAAWNSVTDMPLGSAQSGSFALSYITGDVALWTAGNKTAGPANAPIGLAPTSVLLGGSGANKWNGHIGSFIYWGKQLSETLLTEM